MARTFEQLVPALEGRFEGISRPYGPAEVERLRGSVEIMYTLAERGANRLWKQLNEMPYVNSLGAVTGNQAMQQARAGLPAIYLSGWQVAADANTAGAMYPDQSLYPANAGPELCRRINRTFQRADQIEHAEGGATIDWFVPIVADAEAGFGGPLNAFEIMKAYIEAGAAGVHFEDQLASEKKCGHMGGKVLIPTAAHERNLIAARLAADVCGVPTLVLARTDAESAKLITSDIDERDHAFITGERTAEGFYRLKPGTGLDHCIKRGLSFAKYADLLWWETSKPDLEGARRFAEAVKKVHPDKMLAYNCSPSFNWEANLDKAAIAQFQKEIAAMGYKFQFVTLAGFHSLNHGMFELARGYKTEGMAAYSRLQQAEFASEQFGYSATRHQREVGTGYFDLVSTTITAGQSSTTALHDSTEAAQFKSQGSPINVQAAE
ncbi:isocitrate lyase [Nitrobacter sp. Nb-311A]|uniref:isocitrate lyase n=1 Tax=unclassified Nitrobacter TaxID=2620411 RepID=UPI000068704E|nr:MULTISPECIES: isocitrate lyase [unclassified Nitrobacter]EAQ35829.1 isocitrate lyase [Nitrobacter sp. Nb-311A]MCB1393315.1 isocitrate lyase [Nitrobacter sp.]MCV0386386.1 isocitrate lyase [Nitrobacter sp.]